MRTALLMLITRITFFFLDNPGNKVKALALHDEVKALAYVDNPDHCFKYLSVYLQSFSYIMYTQWNSCCQCECILVRLMVNDWLSIYIFYRNFRCKDMKYYPFLLLQLFRFNPGDISLLFKLSNPLVIKPICWYKCSISFHLSTL